MSSLHALVCGKPMPMIIAQLEKEFTLHYWPEIGENAAKITAICMAGHVQLNDDFMAKFPNLKQISSFGVGYDSIDAVAAHKRGVVVTNTPDVLTQEVADTALALLLATVREIPQQDKYLREGKWVQAAYPLTRTLQELKIGIVGMGRIGKAICKRLEAFGLEVSYHNRSKTDVPQRYFDSLKEMATHVDVLLSVLPGGASTKHLINAEILTALGGEGILINIGRGSVVDEVALIAALQKGVIAMAGLDVFENEPNVPQALIDLPNTVLLPHIGSATHYTRNKMGQLVVDNLLAFKAGKRVLTPVSETPVG